MKYILLTLSLILLLTLSSGHLNAQTTTLVATGLENPRGIAVLPDGRLLLVEAGTGLVSIDPLDHSGKLSILDDLNYDGDYDDDGEIVRIFQHFYSYNTLTRYGTGHDEVGGAGDIVILDDGRILVTQDDSFDEIGVMQITPDYRVLNQVMTSHATINALAYDSQEQTLYAIESGLNRLSAVTLSNGEKQTIVDFPLLEHNQQAVPSGIAFDPQSREVYVTLFSGQLFDYFGAMLSFLPGDSKVVRINPQTGEIQDVITGLTTAVDVALDEEGNLFVAEFTTQWPSTPMPFKFDLFDPHAPPDDGGYRRFSGRVSMYPADGGEAIILADGLDQPSNLTYHDGALYVSTGQGTPGRPIIGADGQLSHIVGEISRITDFEG